MKWIGYLLFSQHRVQAIGFFDSKTNGYTDHSLATLGGVLAVTSQR